MLSEGAGRGKIAGLSGFWKYKDISSLISHHFRFVKCLGLAALAPLLCKISDKKRFRNMTRQFSFNLETSKLEKLQEHSCTGLMRAGNKRMI